MSLKMRIIVGSWVIVMGIILFLRGEYFVGILLIIVGAVVSLNVENTWNNKLLDYGLGALCLIGGILFFFFPDIISHPPSGNLSKPFSYIGGVLFTIGGIYIIFRGLLTK